MLLTDRCLKVMHVPFFAIALVSVSPLRAAEADVPQQGYTTETLRAPIFDVAHVAVDTVAFNNWLNENYQRLSVDQLKNPREHLYYLIDSRIKQQFTSTGRVFPKEHDLILEVLFSWAERLGVYGGNLIFNNVKSSRTPARPPLMAVPGGMTLSMKEDLLNIRSELGWEVSVPYYFMIGELQDLTATNGVRTQLMMISTGAAKDKSDYGHSQATLVFIFSLGADADSFRSYWRQQFGLGLDDERVALGVNGLTSQRNFDAKLILHKEMVFFDGEQGAFAVAYLGNDGTYQWNRPHFLDFLRAVHTEALSPR